MVQSLCNQLLACAPFPDHQNRPIERSRTARSLDGIEKSQALADKLIGPFQ